MGENKSKKPIIPTYSVFNSKNLGESYENYAKQQKFRRLKIVDAREGIIKSIIIMMKIVTIH